MSLSITGADLGSHDPDRLLQGYRAARAQDKDRLAFRREAKVFQE